MYTMIERVVKFMKSSRQFKKYVVILEHKLTKKTRKLHFGDTRYQQYRDSTPIKAYSSKDHKDIKRMRRYYLRHSGISKRLKAIEKEKRISKFLYTPKILSHMYLW